MSSNPDNLQNSLTAPADKDRSITSTFRLGTTLTEEDVHNAMQELNVNTFTKRFPRAEKFYADPDVPALQTYSLISFLPAKGSAPDSDGVYGMLKVRGSFATEEEADLKAERIIRSGDSFHSIYHVYTGRPFPLTKDKKYISDVKEIDLKKNVSETYSAETRKKRNEESSIIKEIEDKQKELLADVSETKEYDPIERYTELMVKKAQLVWTYSETAKKMADMKTNIIAAREMIAKMDLENPECKEHYMQKYMDARERANLPKDDNSFLKYMGNDVEENLGF